MSTESTLKKIEKTLTKITERQDEICERLAGLEAAEQSRPGALAAKTIGFLDQFRAGEALGEASLGAWIEACRDPGLKGALRTVQQREGMHAVLLAQRIKELGGSPKAEVPEAVFDAAMQQSANREKSDAEKVSAFIARFSDIDEALRPIAEMADQLDGDPETQGLLRTICQDERSTLECLTAECARLNG